MVSSGFLLDCKHSPVPGERQSWGEEGDAGWPGPGDAVGRKERWALGRAGGAQFGVLALLLPCPGAPSGTPARERGAWDPELPLEGFGCSHSTWSLSQVRPDLPKAKPRGEKAAKECH